MIRDENGLLTGYVYVDVSDRDPGSYVAEARRILHNVLKLPPATQSCGPASTKQCRESRSGSKSLCR